MGRGEQRASPRRIDAAERRRKALQLKLAGATYEQIARTPVAAGSDQTLYSSRKRAHEAVKRELDELAAETKDTAEQLRAMELARLESMQVALWPSTRPSRPVTCDGCGHEMYREPSLEAIDRVIKILERRAKYLGLDAGGRADQSSGSDSTKSMLESAAKGLAQMYDAIKAEEAAAGNAVGDPVEPQPGDDGP